MTEKRFTIIDGIKKGTHSGIWDNQKQNNQRIGDELWVGEVVAMLNEGVMIVEENEQLKQQNKMLRTNVGKLTDDVKYLRNLPSTHQKENKQLKEYNLRITKILEDGGVILTKNQLKSLIEMKNDDSVEVRHLKSANAKLKDENQSLKNHIQMLQKHIKRLENDNIKTYTLIKEAYKTERTALGKSVLKQLLEAIQ